MLCQNLGGLGKGAEVLGRKDLAAVMIKQKGRECGDPGKATAIQSINKISNFGDVFGRKAAFMAAIECIPSA